jgi:hypothetical protein
MTDDAPRDTRDLRLIFKATAIVAVVAATVIGSLMWAAAAYTRLVTRLEAVEAWQQRKDREATRELWRRDRPPLSPGIQPQQGITRREVDVRIVEIDGERYAVLLERDLLGIVAAAEEFAARVKRCEVWL